ncbi:MAG: hypothetical protein WC803_06170 [Sphingomonas sp.]|jgi:hypothetical protein
MKKWHGSSPRNGRAAIYAVLRSQKDSQFAFIARATSQRAKTCRQPCLFKHEQAPSIGNIQLFYMNKT